jgi:hypothetical protein
MTKARSKNAGAAASLALTALLVGCGVGDSLPTSVDAPLFAVGDYNDTYSAVPGIVNVCMFPPPGSTYLDHVTGTFSASATGGSVISGTFTLDQTPPLCIEAWNATSSATVTVTASLLSLTSGYALDRIVTVSGDGTSQTITGASSASVVASDLTGGFIWFKLKFADTPGGGGGCTPGYWKQPHHFDSWASPYTPSTPFSSVFANAFPGKTLLQVLSLGGGGLNALGRHAVAALLNAASPIVDYDYTVAEVISRFNAAYASGSKATIEEQKNIFDFLNNQGCNLN